MWWTIRLTNHVFDSLVKTLQLYKRLVKSHYGAIFPILLVQVRIGPEKNTVNLTFKTLNGGHNNIT